MTIRRCLICSSLAAFLLPSGGCIVEEIRDQLVEVNTSLDSVESGLERLDTTNATLGNLDDRLDQLEGINASLESIDAELKEIDEGLAASTSRLTTIEAGLDELDEHLASLRRTINNIDSTIPFLKLSGDDEDAGGAEGEEHTEGQAGNAGADDGTNNGTDDGDAPAETEPTEDGSR